MRCSRPPTRSSARCAAPRRQAPIPPPPVVRTVVPSARDRSNLWQMTTEAPGAGLDWTKPGYVPVRWVEAAGGYVVDEVCTGGEGGFRDGGAVGVYADDDVAF